MARVYVDVGLAKKVHRIKQGGKIAYTSHGQIGMAQVLPLVRSACNIRISICDERLRRT